MILNLLRQASRLLPDHLHHLRTAPDGRSCAIFLPGMLGPDSPTWWIRLFSMPAPIGLQSSVDP